MIHDIQNPYGTYNEHLSRTIRETGRAIITPGRNLYVSENVDLM